jgi:hypothetical protein
MAGKAVILMITSACLKAAELTAPLAFTTESVGILEELGERLMSPMPRQR